MWIKATSFYLGQTLVLPLKDGGKVEEKEKLDDGWVKAEKKWDTPNVFGNKIPLNSNSVSTSIIRSRSNIMHHPYQSSHLSTGLYRSVHFKSKQMESTHHQVKGKRDRPTWTRYIDSVGREFPLPTLITCSRVIAQDT
ncbi:hypothetical protein TNIN_262571 [Trichonephila inaurata madagascariensis]|uniref:Uncharacterized protein n=1 Tax=Trichonephila inaurata madagascariensis TaxID=2747483 RepID=A0A8X6WUQ9_9ARAC|nr:hypothetical protein TNIN_262571 [Trichonephila inaurata madagascariensis]